MLLKEEKKENVIEIIWVVVELEVMVEKRVGV